MQLDSGIGELRKVQNKKRIENRLEKSKKKQNKSIHLDIFTQSTIAAIAIEGTIEKTIWSMSREANIEVQIAYPYANCNLGTRRFS